MSQPVPHNLEAERALLGSILLDNAVLGTALTSIRKSDLFSDGHRRILDRMEDLAGRNITIDLVTLCEALSADGLLEKVGGAGYLAALTDGVPMGVQASIAEYCQIIRQKSDLRTIANLANSLMARALGQGESPAELVESAINKFLEFDQNSGAESKSYTFREAADSLLRMLESKSLLRIDSGIPKLDNLAGGFLAGELAVITAEPGAGKTLLAQQIRRHACRHGLHGLFASAEMLKEQLAARELAGPADVQRYKFRFPEALNPQDWTGLARATSEQCRICRILDGEVSIPRISAMAKRMKQEGNLSLVMVDYDELVTAPGKDDLERQAVVATACKSLAKQMQVPVFLLSQLRKLLTGETRRRPTLDRLYGSGAKKKHASSVIFIWRKYVETYDREDLHTAEISVIKNRNGTQGAIPMYFTDSLEFRELTEVEDANRQTESKSKRPQEPKLPYKDGE